MRNIHVTPEPVTLEGFQAVLKPSKFGYTLKATVGDDLISQLETEREDCLKWAESKISKPKDRCIVKPTPWEQVSDGKYLIKFSWSEDKKPPIVDTEGTPIENTDTPVYAGSKVKLGFIQKPYILKDGTTYGTSLKLSGVQIVAIQSEVGVDAGDLDEAGAAELFGSTAGFKTQDPNVKVIDTTPASVEDDF